MEKPYLVSRMNGGVKNPNIVVVFNINYEDFEVSFYSKEKISHTDFDMSLLPGWCKTTDSSYAYNIQPKFLENVYAEIKVNGQVVEKIKIRNNPISSLKCKVRILYNNNIRGLSKRSGKRRILAMFVPKKYRQNVYNKLLDGIIKKEGSNFRGLNRYNVYEYNYWIKNFEEFSEIKEYEYNPKLSVIIPVYNCPILYLRECFDSILNQSYQNFEICICDDASTDADVVKVLKEYEEMDSRIKVFYSEKNGHISKATNNALSIATGEFVVFMDNDDTICPYAFNEVIKTINENKDVDLIYSDEDKMDLDGTRMHPNFKPDFSKETLLGNNYLCHLVIVRKVLVDKVNGIREGYEGVQDHDFLVRATELTTNIIHIPKMLYHWRMIPGSTAVTVENKPYVSERGVKMVEDTLKRRGCDGEAVVMPPGSTYAAVLSNNNERISIVIPVQSNTRNLESYIKTIYKKSSYKNFEIIVVGNIDVKNEMTKFLEKYEERDNFKVLRLDDSTNLSHLYNEAVKVASGEYVLLLKDNIQVINEDWLEVLLGHARLNDIGAVGALVLYADNIVKECGVILGDFNEELTPNISAAKTSEVIRVTVPSNTSAVTSSCLMVSKNKFMEIGMFDEDNLSVSLGDIDFCLRLMEKGYRNVVHPFAKVYHHELNNKSVLERKKISEEEVKYFQKRHTNMLENDPFYNSNFSRKYAYKIKVK